MTLLDRAFNSSSSCNIALENGIGSSPLWLQATGLYVMMLLSERVDRKSTRLNSSHLGISYAVFCLKKRKPFARSQPGRTVERIGPLGRHGRQHVPPQRPLRTLPLPLFFLKRRPDTHPPPLSPQLPSLA